MKWQSIALLAAGTFLTVTATAVDCENNTKETTTAGLCPQGEGRLPMKTEKINLPPDAWNMISGVRLVENRYENRPALVFSGEEPECVLETDVRSVPGRYFRIEADIAADPQGSGTCDVYRIRLSQPGRQDERDFVPVPYRVEPFRTIVPEPFFEAEPSLPLKIRLERVNRDPRNSCRAETGVLSVRLVPMTAPTGNLTVSSVPGYNSWPFIQNLNGCLCCVYSRGTCHHFGEIRRGVFARTTADGGKSWGPEYTVVNTPEGADSAIGKGLDSTGAIMNSTGPKTGSISNGSRS